MKAPSRIQWCKWIGLAMLAVVFVALSVGAGGSAKAQAPVAQLAVVGCPSDTVQSSDIVISDVADLYSADLQVSFNKDMLEVAAVDIPADSVFAAPGVAAPLDVAKFNADGVISFVATRENTQTVFSGSGVLFTVRWNVKGACDPARPSVAIAEHGTGIPPAPPQLSTRDGMDIPYTAVSCACEQQPEGEGCTISGRVSLQGRTGPDGQRPDHAGTDIFVSTERTCPTNTQFAALWDWPGIVMVKTGPDGSFSVQVAPGKSCQCLYAARRGYLTAQGVPPYPYTGAVAMQDITLLGGDATQDGAINVFDLALIASQYGGADPVGDINGDGKVDIYDLALAAGNSGVARGPQQWMR